MGGDLAHGIHTNLQPRTDVLALGPLGPAGVGRAVSGSRDRLHRLWPRNGL